MKDKFAFFWAYKSPIPKRRKLLAKRPFFKAKRALFKSPSKLDRVSFSTPVDSEGKGKLFSRETYPSEGKFCPQEMFRVMDVLYTLRVI